MVNRQKAIEPNKHDFRFQATAKAEKGELMIYGEITDQKWDDDCVVPKEIDAELKKLESVSQLDIRINSYGGSVFAGQAIATMLMNFKAYKTVYIEGIAASMASVIAMSGDKVVMPGNAMMMVHKPSSLAWGNAEDMRKSAEMLDKVEESLIALYMRRFKGTEDEIKKLLADETWLTAEEALRYGFCDEVEKSVDVAASAKGMIIGGLNVPDDIFQKIKDKMPTGTKGAEKEMDIKDTIKQMFGVEVTDSDTLTTALEKIAEAQKIAAAAAAAQIVPVDAAAEVTVENGRVTVKDGDGKVIYDADVVPDDYGELSEKAKAYDTIKKQATDAACVNGVKAKGDKFDKDRWCKIFNSFSVDEINAQAQEWMDEAAEVLNAGKRKSVTNTVRSFNTNKPESCDDDFMV